MRTTFFIQNLKCGGCGKIITDALNALPRIETTIISTDENSVSFDYEEPIALEEVEATLSRLGYPVDGSRNTLLKKAKSYVSCAIGRMK